MGATVQIQLAVPAATSSFFLIVADRLPLQDVDAALHEFLDLCRGPAALVAAAATEGSASLKVSSCRAVDSRFNLADLAAFTDRSDLRPDQHVFIVESTALCREQPLSAQVARAFARDLATQTDGIMIDWSAAEIVLTSGNQRSECPIFVLHDWLGFDFDVHDDRHVGFEVGKTIWERRPTPAEVQCGAQRIQTVGLCRFGLPEVFVDDVDCINHGCALNVVRAVSQHLLAEHWEWLRSGAAGARQISAQQEVSSATFGSYWGTRRSCPNAASLVVTLAPAHDARLLRVHPPSRNGGPRRLNEWLAHDIDSWYRHIVALPPDHIDEEYGRWWTVDGSPPTANERRAESAHGTNG